MNEIVEETKTVELMSLVEFDRPHICVIFSRNIEKCCSKQSTKFNKFLVNVSFRLLFLTTFIAWFTLGNCV